MAFKDTIVLLSWWQKKEKNYKTWKKIHGFLSGPPRFFITPVHHGIDNISERRGIRSQIATRRIGQ